MRLNPRSAYFVSIALLAWLLFSTTSQAAIQIRDGQGEKQFARVPERVVVLDWDLLEQVLALDVLPLAAPNIAGYQQWVANPPAPDSMQDLGTRAEPNLETIAALKPDVILASAQQRDLLPVLASIAPVVYLPNFAKQDSAAEVVIEQLKTLGTLFGKSERAQQRLDALDVRFAQLSAQLRNAFAEPPEVVVMRFSNLNTLLLSSENSINQYVLQRLGLINPLVLPAKPWGVSQKRINVLQQLTSAYVLYIRPFPQEKNLREAVLWNALPAAQQGRVNGVRSVWSYGGVLSLQSTAEAITESLLELAKEPK